MPGLSGLKEKREELTKPKRDGVSTAQRLVSSCAGSLLTSFFVTPLDVVKVRLQAQTHITAPPPAAVRISPTNFDPCTHYLFCNGLMDHMCLKKDCPGVFQPPAAPQPQFRGTLDAFVKVVRNEGITKLWSGLPPTLVMAVPANVFYFTAYDELQLQLDAAGVGPLTPFIAGAGARIIAATVVSPLELIRTQTQSEAAVNGNAKSTGMLRRIRKVVQSNGIRGLFKGLGPTFLRDVPFSAIYWASYEQCKRTITRRYHGPHSSPHSHPLSHSFWIAFASGAISGSIAGALTTPFDVVKTRMQINMYSTLGRVYPDSTLAILSTIMKEEGWKGMTAGMIPRIARVAPSCAIMIGTYELGKRYFATSTPALASSPYSASLGSSMIQSVALKSSYAASPSSSPLSPSSASSSASNPPRSLRKDEERKAT